MSVRRVMGTETEYGVTRPGDPRASAVHVSGAVVRADASGAGPERALQTGSGGDYADETPLRDARGYEMARALADLGQLTDLDDPATANSVLSNGARLYVDHAHPAYSTPEVLTPRDAVTWDRPGDAGRLPARSTRAVTRSVSTRTTWTARAPPTAATRTTWCRGPSRSWRSPRDSSRTLPPGRWSAEQGGSGWASTPRCPASRSANGPTTSRRRSVW